MLTTEQIIALAPDASSEKNGRGLANISKWQTLGRTGRAVWGECRGSGKNPYQTAIDLTEPAFKCSCPSRKFPCKHALGLFLLLAAQENQFKAGDPPAFCTDWLDKRDAQKEKKKIKPEQELTAEEAAKREKSKVKRAAEREQKVEQGIGELERWLCDLIRQGLAAARNRPGNFWENTAKRMIDAQAPGLARLVRELSGTMNRSSGWAESFLEKAGKIYLLIEAYRNLENLQEEVRHDVRTAIGWTLKETDLENEKTVADHWLVAGQKNYEEDKLRVRRTWLSGEKTGRSALVLDFAFQNRPPDAAYVVGTKIEAELVFYPGNFPLRAAVKARGDNPEQCSDFNGLENFQKLLEAHAAALAANLWLEVFPASLQNVIPVFRDNDCLLRDRNGGLLPVAGEAGNFWNLIALSGGNEINVFGEWDGRTLSPLRAFCGGRTIQI